MAMHAWESAIMNLWDAGASIETIACNTGRTREQVNRVVSRYAIADGDRAQRAAMRRGSAFLLKAIQITGKRHRAVPAVGMFK